MFGHSNPKQAPMTLPLAIELKKMRALHFGEFGFAVQVYASSIVYGSVCRKNTSLATVVNPEDDSEQKSKSKQ